MLKLVVCNLVTVPFTLPVPPLPVGSVPVTLEAKLTYWADEEPVPPLVMGSTPDTWVTKLIPPSEPPRVKLPEVVTEPVSVSPLTVPVPPTDVTVPVALDVPAPIAVRKAEASSEETVLSALKRGNVTELGLLIVNRFAPSVVAPKFVRAPDAVVEPEPPDATGRAVPSVKLVKKLT